MQIPQSSGGKRTGRAKGILILCGVILALAGLAFAVVVGFDLLGTSTEIASEEVTWQIYRQPDGEFQVELPGKPEVSTLDVPAGFGTVKMKVVGVTGKHFDTSVRYSPELMPVEVNFVDAPINEDDFAGFGASMGISNAKLVGYEIVEGTDAKQMDLEISGMRDGKEVVLFTRLISKQKKLYQVMTVGPTEHRDSLLDANTMAADSLKAPA